MRYVVTPIRLLFLVLFLFLLANGKMMLWLGLFAVSLVAALIFGRIYCGFVCPMNTLMTPAERVSKKFKLQTKDTPRWLKSGFFAWTTLVISIAAMLLSKRLLHINPPILPFWLVISILVTFRYKPSVFHNLICPFGVLQRTFGQFAGLSKKVDKSKCTGCGICERACPSEAITVVGEEKKAVINPALCHQCSSCQQVCVKAAIRYSK